ncbi:aldo/keto reductase [Propionicicella superfundia]|uniref:aldo/keto reductase n=1 Tax=Propionicicella superfundia TaxID=348582 RepID=UPI000685FA34|nr:aldo/keto reductase [Propionicicella superfundia]
MTLSYRPLGHSGLMVSKVGVGTNAFGARVDQATTTEIVSAAIDQGINLFDTADLYADGRSEEFLGNALGSRREHVILATKFGLTQAPGEPWDAIGSRRFIRRAVEASLRRLGTDYIDLYQIHRPDPGTPIAETLRAMAALVDEGKVRYIGCSNFSAWQVTEAHWAARELGIEGFVSAQNEYSLYNRSAQLELTPACAAAGMGVLPYYPLAAGLLTGKYRRGEAAPEGSRLAHPSQAKKLTGADFDKVEALAAYAEERGIPLLTLAISGLAAQPMVASVISGVSRPEQIAVNIEAASWEPTSADLDALDEIPGLHAGSYTGFATSDPNPYWLSRRLR